jgi:orotidine-5'-phosphate decarboxylase
MLDLKEKLIVALDVDSLEKAQHYVDLLLPKVNLFKVGSQLFTACGPEAIKIIGSKNARVFLDLKFHDIPNTVYSAVASGTSSSITISSLPTGLEGVSVKEQVKEAVSFPVFMMTLHTIGGIEMLKAAVRGAADKAVQLKIKKPYLVGVTVLTSEAADKDSSSIVMERAHLAKSAGLDGVVCSASEAAMIRKEFGRDFIIVTPGIRQKDAPRNDQKRTATASEAIEAGADFFVVGRPILEAKDPLKALTDLI